MADDVHDMINIMVDPEALGPGLADEAMLIGIGKALLHEHCAQDVSRSQSARGNITLQDARTHRYELQAIFLYKESYTAVNHRIVFALRGHKYTVISVE